MSCPVCFSLSPAANPFLQPHTSLRQHRQSVSRPRSLFHRRPRPRGLILAIASNGGGDSSGDGSSDEDGAGSSPDGTNPPSDGTGAPSGNRAFDVRSGRVNDLLARLDKIDLPEDPDAEIKRARADRYLQRESQLIWLSTRLFGEMADDCSSYLNEPVHTMVAASLAILFGFFSATSAATIIGSVADWDPLAAAVLLVWTEAFTRVYYSAKEKTLVLRLANAFKIGLIYGMAVDAFKLSTVCPTR